MNRYCLSVFLVALAVLGVVLGAPEKSFEENLAILRKINLDEVLPNDRLVKSFVDCMCGTKTCTHEGTALKATWKQLLDNRCKEKCTEEDKTKVKQVIKHLYVKHRNWWDELAAQLDKDEEYRNKYKKQLEAIVNDDSIKV
ncbi:allergen Tha p 1 [Diabrotica virgifera virgifera]|uniref:Allergen Tha p 1-like n=1 Tax=Diabrotica virgifera virgifera TaxID=50390 RepID=A0A6P7G3D4_DIAVI|nr:allergen Tha p 1 [Diabrotica virgifera virgifera]